jgi:uncharacterized protein YecE (DUF72 family)
MRPRGNIHVGIGGWSYEPWRETFYPPEVAKSRELEYASRQVSAIEINSTFYRLQKPATYAKWRDSTPDEFVFTVKAPRFIVQRRSLADAGASIERFVGSGIASLERKLGAVLWQLDPTHAFDPDDLEAFLQLLPPMAGRWPLRHALEVRHASFVAKEFIALIRRHAVAVVCVDDAEFPACADITAEFVYVRLRRCAHTVSTGYAAPALRTWADYARRWARGEVVSELPRAAAESPVRHTPREVFIYFINGAKERAPAAARALLAALKRKSGG